jgi:hypothetical protein
MTSTSIRSRSDGVPEASRVGGGGAIEAALLLVLGREEAAEEPAVGRVAARAGIRDGGTRGTSRPGADWQRLVRLGVDLDGLVRVRMYVPGGLWALQPRSGAGYRLSGSEKERGACCEGWQEIPPRCHGRRR